MKRGTRVYLWAHLSALDQHPHPPTSRINPLDHWRDRLLITCPKPEPRRRLAKISPTAKAPGDHKVTVHTAIDRLNTKARKNIQARGHVMTPIPLLPPNPRNMADNVSRVHDARCAQGDRRSSRGRGHAWADRTGAIRPKQRVSRRAGAPKAWRREPDVMRSSALTSAYAPDSPTC